MFQLTQTQRNLVKIAGGLGVVQATAWITLSIFVVANYNKQIPSFTENYNGLLKAGFETIFLNEQFSDTLSEYLDLHVKIAFLTDVSMYLYLVFNVIWLAASVMLYLVKNKPKQLTKYLHIWSIMAEVMCTLDLVLVIILGLNYDRVSKGLFTDYYLQDPSTMIIVANVYLLSMIIAGRGFILWILNLIFAYLTCNMAITIRKRNKETTLMMTSSQLLNQPPPQIPRIFTNSSYGGNGAQFDNNANRFYQYAPVGNDGRGGFGGNRETHQGVARF